MDIFAYYDIVLFDFVMIELAMIYFVFHTILRNLKLKDSIAYLPMFAAFFPLIGLTIRTVTHLYEMPEGVLVYSRVISVVIQAIGAVLILIPYIYYKNKHRGR